jgi:superfamily I DNA/RNA helicase
VLDSIEPKFIFDGKPLNQPQISCITQATEGKNLSINAVAGSGKTFLLKALSSLVFQDKKGLLLSFNKKIIEDARKVFPKNVKCSTVHSLAYSKIGHKYQSTGKLQKVLSKQYIWKNIFAEAQTVHGINGELFSSIVYKAINEFCQNSDPELTLDTIKKVKSAQVTENEELALLDAAKYIWSMCEDLNSPTPISNDIYLKIWALDSAPLKYDFILIDEAQDQTEAIIKYISNQNAQLIWVGDKYQQIYEWRGASNAFNFIPAGTKTLNLNISYRFGQDIAKYCTLLLNNLFNEEIEVKGSPQIDSRIAHVSSKHTIIYRTNLSLFTDAFSFLLMGKKPYIIGGVVFIKQLLNGAQNLINGKPAYIEELSNFKDWKEVVEFSLTEDGINLRVLVQLISSNPPTFLWACFTELETISEQKSDVILTTTHKSKGLQWNQVKLANDFKLKSNKYYTAEEGNLLYVAVTRAINVLDISECEAAQEICISPPPLTEVI